MANWRPVNEQGFTPAQDETLRLIADNPRISLMELAQRRGVTNPAIKATIDRLIELGAVVRGGGWRQLKSIHPAYPQKETRHSLYCQRLNSCKKSRCAVLCRECDQRRKLGFRQKQVLHLLEKKPDVTHTEIAQSLGVSKSQSGMIIQRLKKKGLLPAEVRNKNRVTKRQQEFVDYIREHPGQSYSEIARGMGLYSSHAAWVIAISLEKKGVVTRQGFMRNSLKLVEQLELAG